MSIKVLVCLCASCVAFFLTRGITRHNGDNVLIPSCPFQDLSYTGSQTIRYEYMTESEARAVARWDVGSSLRMIHKTKQVGFEPVCESLHSWSISYGGWDFIPNLGGTVAEGTPTTVSITVCGLLVGHHRR